MIAATRIRVNDNYYRERGWQTRADPFARVWKQIRRQIQKNPSLKAKTLFAALQRRHPGKFGDGQLRTLQRRIRSWRATEGLGKKVLVSGRPDQTSIGAVITGVQLENPYQRAFLAAFEVNCCVRWAARAAQIARKTHYHWLQYDPAYAAAFRESRIIAAECLEGEAIRRAVEGWEEPVFYQGAICGTVRRYDSGLTQFLLRGLKPETYGTQRPNTKAG
jgi:hypothetical protein